MKTIKIRFKAFVWNDETQSFDESTKFSEIDFKEFKEFKDYLNSYKFRDLHCDKKKIICEYTMNEKTLRFNLRFNFKANPTSSTKIFLSFLKYDVNNLIKFYSFETYLKSFEHPMSKKNWEYIN